MPLTGPIAGVYTVTGQVTAPTLGQVIATIAVSPGAYAIAFGGYLSGPGNPAAIDSDNLALQSDPSIASTFVTSQVLLVPPAVSVPIVLFHLPLYALTTIRIIAVVGGTTNVVYHASIAASYPGPAGSLI